MEKTIKTTLPEQPARPEVTGDLGNVLLHSALIGIGVHDAWQGRGIGSRLLAELVDAADNWMGLRRLELTVFADNEPALALYRRFGFVVEGRSRGFAMRAGKLVDALHMARLAAAPPFAQE